MSKKWNFRPKLIISRPGGQCLGYLSGDTGCPQTCRATNQATILNLSTGVAIAVSPGASAYSISKVALTQFASYVAVKHKNIRSIAIHPGIIRTALLGDNSPFMPFSEDDLSLSGGFAVWLTTEEADFLDGRYVDAN